MRRHDDPPKHSEAEAKEAWSLAIVERVGHQDDCGHCTPALDPSPIRIACPEGVRLADAEQAAYQAWSRSRFAGVMG